MMQKDPEKVLFPDELIHWDHLTQLVSVLLQPFRHRSKGIDCITCQVGLIRSSPNTPFELNPFELKGDDRDFIKSNLHRLPSLEFPIHQDVAKQFIDEFILLPEAPNYLPWFLKFKHLEADQDDRDHQKDSEKKYLQELLLKNEITLIDSSRRKCSELWHGAYFSRNEAVKHLNRMGLLDRATAADRSWSDQISSPYIEGLDQHSDDSKLGFTADLLKMGVEDYRRVLLMRRNEAAVARLNQVLQKSNDVTTAPLAKCEKNATEPVRHISNDIPSAQVVDESARAPLTPESDINTHDFLSIQNIAVGGKDQISEGMKPVVEVQAVGNNKIDSSGSRFLGMKEVLDMIGISRPTIYNYLNQNSPSYDPSFPKPRQTNGINKWFKSEIEAWMESLDSTKKKIAKKPVSKFGVNLQPSAATEAPSALALVRRNSSGREEVENPRPASVQTSTPAVAYDIMLGVNGESPQYGLLGELSGRKIALDLNNTHTISLFGAQGGGKSYTLGTVIEMASMPLQLINVLPSPLATLIFHYSPTQDYAPECASMINANSVDQEIRILRERYKTKPEALRDVLILTPRSNVDKRKSEYPDIEVKPIAFSAQELKTAHWKFLMGIVGNQSTYVRKIEQIMRTLRSGLTLNAFRAAIDSSGLSANLKELAQTRLSFASEYIDNDQRLQDLIRPGRLIIVDLRDDYIEKNEALGLFVVMLQIFSEATYQERTFNKLVVFDEAHKYIENGVLLSNLIELIREMRHKGTSILVASQDPSSVPVALIELSSQIILHKFNSPTWLKHIQKANAALGELTPEDLSNLGVGEAYVWSREASDATFSKGAVKIKCRPRITHHGGSTRIAVSDHL